MRLERQRTLVSGKAHGGLTRPHANNLATALIIAIVAIGLAAVVPLTQFSGSTVTNARLQQLSQEKADWNARIHEIQVDIATMGGLSHIATQAQYRFQMVQPDESIYIEVDSSIPSSEAMPSRFMDTGSPDRQIEEDSLVEKLFGWIPIP